MLKTLLRPRACTRAQLEKAGVSILYSENTVDDHKTFLLECGQCGKSWNIRFHREGKPPRGYWRCPQGCNHA